MVNGREGEEDISLTPKHKQTSHIPGLSLAMHDADNEENASRRRIGIVETDSNYVKLAKQGGHKGLLWHEDTTLSVRKPTPYKPPAWFSNDTVDHMPLSTTKRTGAGFLGHEEFQKGPKMSTTQPLDSPFGGDNKSAWQREADRVATEEIRAIDNSANQLKELTITPQHFQDSKFRKHSSSKNPAPVSMAKLLSFAYLEEDRTPARSSAHSPRSPLTGSPVGLEVPE
ncbi:uncharacterized protein C7orf57-like [Engraulis encrasicolus]|uniref:uncharacterized protein C7orf57-like n=1 Tax=Engraulis encrasicolus TaxID=184585 RepID=UPI002FCEBBC9